MWGKTALSVQVLGQCEDRDGWVAAAKPALSAAERAECNGACRWSSACERAIGKLPLTAATRSIT